MSPGETINDSVIDAGYGAYNPAFVFKVQTSQIANSLDTSLVKLGMVLRMGNGMECRVTEMNEEEWTLDANHALAGSAYEIDVRLESVENGIDYWGYVVDEEGVNGRYRVATFGLGCFWGGGTSLVRYFVFYLFVFASDMTC